MLKRIIVTTLAIFCIFALMGCTSKGSTADKKKASDSSPAPQPRQLSSETYYMLSYDATEDEIYENADSEFPSMYLVDENGNKKSDFTRDLKEFLKEKDIKAELNTYVQYYEPTTNIFYAYLWTKDAEGDGLYAIDVNSKKLKQLISGDDFDTVKYIDYYKHKLYIGVYNYNKPCDEFVFTVSDDFTFTRIKNENNIINNENYFPIPNTFKSCFKIQQFSMARAFDELGYVVLQSKSNDNEESLIQIFPDNSRKKIDSINIIDDNILYYDKEKIVYSKLNSTGDESFLDIYKLYLKTNKTKKILTTDYDSVVEVSNNKMNYIDGFSLYEFNFVDNETKLVFSNEKKPGVNIELTQCYQIQNDNFFVCFLNGADIKFHRIDNAGEQAELVDIGCPIGEVSNYKYGTVLPGHTETECPFCNTIISTYDYELFQLSDEHSKYASKINRSLKEKMDDFLNKKFEIEDESRCELHNEEYFINAYEEMKLKGVEILNDKFLTVTMNEYYYGGGPHGTYYTEQYIYDLETGEELSMKNFFSESEDKFKELIAENAKENYVNNNEDYSFTSENDAYNAVKNGASIDSTYIYYAKDHFTYCFGIYELGAYCDGEYRVDVPYEELNGNANLTRVR